MHTLSLSVIFIKQAIEEGAADNNKTYIMRLPK